MKGVIIDNIKRGHLNDSVPKIKKIIKIKIPVLNTQGVGLFAGDGGESP